ncbi:MAG: inorganic phosphate transporter [Bacteroidales bacterium]|nr:inorganic phosphate transporter [Bacteroidales bacterium]
MTLTIYLVKNFPTYKINGIFKGLQLLSSALFSLGHGTNDAQKTMGIIAVVLYSNGMLGGKEFYVPQWVAISCHVAIALGTLAWGWKVVQTMGVNLTDLKPMHGFVAETSGAISLFFFFGARDTCKHNTYYCWFYSWCWYHA